MDRRIAALTRAARRHVRGIGLVAALIALPAGPWAADHAVGATASPARAFAVGSAPMRTAQAIAERHWGGRVCRGQVAITWKRLPRLVNAQASWVNPRAAYGAGADNADCRVVFSTAADFDWVKFCSVLVHEYGHLAGHDHARDRDAIMAPVYRRPVRACTETRATAARARRAAFHQRRSSRARPAPSRPHRHAAPERSRH